MWLQHLSLHNFRNYLHLELNLTPGLNLFIGNNAQGKTNLLEACHLLATTRSHRAGRDLELIQWSFQSYHLGATIKTGHGTEHLELHYDAHKGKRVQINGVPQPRLSDLIGRLMLVFFAPEHLALVKADPAQRRRFLDILLSQLYHKYLYQLSQYQRLLREKSNLLKSPDPDLQLLKVYNLQLAELGTAITVRRAEAIRQLNELASHYHRQLHPGEQLSLSYASQVPSFSLVPSELQESLELLLRQKQSEELRRRICLVGPHRDDLELTLNNEDAKRFSSQGQQRSIVLALKVAEARYMERVSGERPVLLMDDLFSELDADRQHRLLQLLHDFGQTLVSAVSLPPFLHSLSKSIYHVEQGKIIKHE